MDNENNQIQNFKSRQRLIHLARESGLESIVTALENVQADIFSVNNSGSRATELAAMLDL